MKLQNIVFPPGHVSMGEELYFRKKGNVACSADSTNICLNRESEVGLDTYFNGFSALKWFRYTQISQAGVCLRLKGKFHIILEYKEAQQSHIVSRIIKQEYIDTGGEETENKLVFSTEKQQGMYTVRLAAVEEGGEFYGGYYYSDYAGLLEQDIHIAVVICTYKREEFVYRNLNILRREFLENPGSELYGKLDIIIVDNGQSLNIEETDVHVFLNKNTGGSGGFARGMLECINLSREKKITHVLLMDDDVVIQPESIFRTYTMLGILKPQYRNSFIGGAMLRTDRPWIQTEAGARWNGGLLTSYKMGLDLRCLSDCLFNEQEETYDYHAWWYCTIPMQYVRRDNLPVPLFVRGDDVEYGLRNMTSLIMMNGICIWHEPFEMKYSSSMYYYIYRNRLIVNAMHGQAAGKRETWKEYRLLFRQEVFTMRYQNAWLLLRGIDDYLKGIEWLKKQDAELLNREIMSAGYRMQKTDQLCIPFSEEAYEKAQQYSTEHPLCKINRKLTLNGFFRKADRTAVVPVHGAFTAALYRVGTALHYDENTDTGFVTSRSRKEMMCLWAAYCKTRRNYKRNDNRVRREWSERRSEITNKEFWTSYLGLEQKQ